MTSLSDTVPLLLFAKAPIAGKVKTRLTSDCTDQQAAAIAEILLEESLKVATQFWPGKVLLSVWQECSHPFISKMLERYGLELLPQVAGDLGEKMTAALDAVGYPAAVMGCDAPLVPGRRLRAAHRSLVKRQNVIGPCVDGGYFLIGLSQAQPEVFNGINWGTDSVFDETMHTARKNGVSFDVLDESSDIDLWPDVLKAARVLPSLFDYLQVQGLTQA